MGYSINSRMKSRLAVAALDNAVARRAAEGLDVAGCVVHSDRGSQFRGRLFVYALNRHGMVGSMGRVVPDRPDPGTWVRVSAWSRVHSS